MRSAVPAIDDERFFGDEGSGLRGMIASVFLRRPRDFIGVVVALAAMAAILVNALYLQPGPHPAPIFPVRPRPVASADPTGSVVAVVPRPRPAELTAKPDASATPRQKSEIIADIQRELARRGLYDGAIDGVLGPKTDAAIQDFAEAAGIRPVPDPSEELLRTMARSTVKPPPTRTGPARADPIAELIAPSTSRRVMAAQRALNDYGYGPVKPTGIYGAETKTAIERFEGDRKLPVTGQVSDRLMRELAALTGRPLE